MCTPMCNLVTYSEQLKWRQREIPGVEVIVLRGMQPLCGTRWYEVLNELCVR